MSDTPGSVKSLNVVKTFDPAAKLREMEASDPNASPSGGSLNRQSLIDRALDDLPPELKRLRERIIEELQTVYDPELPVNLYDLGLIYRLDIDADRVVDCDMTLTAPACPVAGEMPGLVETAIKRVEGVKDATVQLVWEPKWGKQMMSDVALLELGLI